MINSIFVNEHIAVNLNDVQHIEFLKHNNKPNGIWAIMKSTRYNFEQDCWDNPLFIPQEHALEFYNEWRKFQFEREDRKERQL